MSALTHDQIRQRYLDLLPDAWFGSGKREGGDSYLLADAIAQSLTHANQQLQAVESATLLRDAEGEELEQQGRDYGVPKQANEPEETFRARVLGNITDPKNTIPAIEQAVTKGTGLPCVVIEPWEQMLTSGRSRLGRAKLQGAYYSHGVFDVQVIGISDLVRAIVEKNRASGYYPFYTTTVRDGGQDDPPEALGGATLLIGEQPFMLDDDALRLGLDRIGLAKVGGGSFFYQTDTITDTDGLYVGMATIIETQEEGEPVSNQTDYTTWPGFRFGDPGRPVGFTVFGV